MRQRDVLIVGAGPAGNLAARRLAESGARVTLFDASHPREKPCGGGLTGRALALVCDVVGSRHLAAVSVGSLRFESGNSSVTMPLLDVGVEPRSTLVIVDRRSFDAALLDAAVSSGAEHVRERVRAVSANGRIEVRTSSGTWKGDFLLGADGATSTVRRQIQAPFSRRQLSVATGYFVHGATSSEIRIRSVCDPPGYIWSFPRSDHLAVGMCAPADRTSVEPLRRIVRGWLETSALGAGAVLRPYSWPIPSLASGDFDLETAGKDRWMLLGDAAGLVDPLTREGIYYALRSGVLAAEALADHSPRTETYADRLREEIYPELRRAADLKARFFSSGFSDLLVSGLQRSEAVRGIMETLVAGRQPYATLKRRLLRTFEVRLALSLLWLQVSGRLVQTRARS